jgi:hypothetical protein
MAGPRQTVKKQEYTSTGSDGKSNNNGGNKSKNLMRGQQQPLNIVQTKVKSSMLAHMKVQTTASKQTDDNTPLVIQSKKKPKTVTESAPRPKSSMPEKTQVTKKPESSADKERALQKLIQMLGNKGMLSFHQMPSSSEEKKDETVVSGRQLKRPFAAT